MDDRTFGVLSETFWSKSDRKDKSSYHLFIYHLLDSGAVALKLWERSIPTGVKKEISAILSLNEDTAGRLLAYWCALHDIGKASPAFQNRIKGLIPPRAQVAYHSQMSGKFLHDCATFPRIVDIAISGHHGSWDGDYENIPGYDYGGEAFQPYREESRRRVAQLLGFKDPPNPSITDKETANLFAVWLSGFISVADWIASNEGYFSYQKDYQNLQGYFLDALERAEGALFKIGWIGWQARQKPVSFQEMYASFIDRARPVQQKIVDLYEQVQPRDPFLAIIEAPTGIGKTEIALYLADRWLQQVGGSGIYIAMPTQATSNSIYERTLKILQERYPKDLIPITLAHGQAAWNERVNAIRLQEIGEETEATVVAAEWFQNNRKRTLLTPFGVGTVDQAFLSVLQTRHFFVRLFGLKNKVVIFDEVHAYDVFMQEIFSRLLTWLRSMGASVIVLSATLPEGFRQEIVRGYCGPGSEIFSDEAYPRLTLAVPGKPVKPVDLIECFPAAGQPVLQIEWLQRAGLIETLRERLAGGGCAAVICNTVGKAQALYKILEEAKLVPEKDLILFHARFPQSRRQEIEQAVLQKFGKRPEGSKNERGEEINPDRPGKAIVVATQVIEQSLDLDFDLMISEVAPIDLIIQRAGRLQRHKRPRPDGLQSPLLILLEPEGDVQDIPDFGNSARIYPRSVLLKSYLKLHELSRFRPVHETRSLIKAVYDDSAAFDLYPEAALLHAWEDSEADEEEKIRRKAGDGLVPLPSDRHLLYARNLELKDDEDPRVHLVYQAMTRNTDGPRVNLICLHRQNDRYFMDEALTQPVDLTRLNEDYPLLKQVLGQSISVSHRGAVPDLLAGRNVVRVKDVSALRSSWIAPFENGVFTTEHYYLTLSHSLGLLIEKC